MPNPPAEVEFTPTGNHRRLWECRDTRVLVAGPAGTGKTRNTLERINYLAWKYAGSRHLMLRKTRAAMSESVLVTWERDVHAGTMHLFGPASRAYRDAYQYPNGSSVVIGGLDNPHKTYSAEYDTITVFEALDTTDNELEQLLRALRNGRMVRADGRAWHQLVAECNPGHERHWLRLRADTGWFKYLHTTHRDNPRYWDGEKWTPEGEQFMASLEGLTGHRRRRLLDGQWCSADGVVYREFDQGTHVIDAMPAGWEKWRKYRSIDFGFNDPFVCQWWADSGEAMYLYREVYMSGRIVEDHARQIVSLSKGEEYECTVADHAKEDRETLHRHGVETMPAAKDIQSGIDAVRSRLVIQPNGRPGVYILRSATVERDGKLLDARRPTSTLEEFDCYVYAKRSTGEEKDAPQDRDNHGMDAMRYAVMYAASGGGGPVAMRVDQWD